MTLWTGGSEGFLGLQALSRLESKKWEAASVIVGAGRH